ncbi:hypothetical protein C0995_002019 [Termitomyces sp. Mi166|nr:hypothetical protein C0995_002019 [Termitomyces sp. Mi166\
MVSPPRQIVVDDADSQIHYFGSGWFEDEGSQDKVGNFGPTYKTTSHGTKGNDSISFSFVGSSVTVWGTTSLKQVDNGTSFDPSWECFVDQISIGATKPFQFPENNWVLCEEETITDGVHVITINVTSTGNTFWFDYITYTPSPSTSYETAVLLVQNTDSAMIYGAGWGALGGTANMTTKVGSEAIFSFVGTSLTWVGFIPTELPHNASKASYSIDNRASVNFPLNGLSPTATTTIYNQVFFTTPDLAIGPHTILITYEGGNGPSTPLTLDYLFVTNTSMPAPLTSSASVTASFPVVSSNPTQSPMVHSRTPVGPIVGGVVGSLSAIAILLSVFWCWRRRRVTHIESGTGFLGTGDDPSYLRTGQPQMSTYMATPSMQRLQAESFTLSNPFAGEGRPSAYVHSRSDVLYGPSSPISPNSDTDNSSSGVRNLSHTPTHTHATSTSDASGYVVGTIDQTRAMRKGRDTAHEPTIAPVVHQDSGIRLHLLRSNVMIEDVPPMYTTT